MRFFFLPLLFLSCCTHETTQYTHHNDGRQKPIVHLNVINAERHTEEFVWCLSEEFMDLIEEQLISNGTVFISSENQPLNQNAEFKATITLLEHQILEKKNEDSSISKSLSIAFNIEITDQRKPDHKVILKERLSDTFAIPSYFDFSYQNQDWKGSLFQFTPIGYAHKKLRQRIINDLEGYCCRAHTYQ